MVVAHGDSICTTREHVFKTKLCQTDCSLIGRITARFRSQHLARSDSWTLSRNGGSVVSFRELSFAANGWCTTTLHQFHSCTVAVDDQGVGATSRIVVLLHNRAIGSADWAFLLLVLWFLV